MNTKHPNHGYGTGHLAPYNDGNLQNALNNPGKENEVINVYLEYFFKGWDCCSSGVDNLKNVNGDESSKKIFASIQEQYERNPYKLPEVDIYRAVPTYINDINNGDWITLSYEYAKEHGERVLNNDYKILQDKVSIDKIWWNGDSLDELGYDSRPIILEQTKETEYSDLVDQIKKLDKGFSVVFTDITDSTATAEIFNGYDEVIESEVEMNLWPNMTSEEILTKFNDKFFNGDFTDFYPGEMDIEVYATSIDEANQILEFCVDISGGAFDGLSFYSEVSSDGIYFDVDDTILSKLDISGIKEEITDLINENIEYDDEIPTDFFEKPSLDDILSVAENKAASQITDFRQPKEIDALAI